MAEFREIVRRLRRFHRAPAPPAARGPFELLMWEHACYLLPDERRALVFDGLKREVGLTPPRILTADEETLLKWAKLGGMRPEDRVDRWREVAQIVEDEFAGDLDTVLREPYAKAKKALKRFPSIGDPGAEKILMFCGMAEGLPLESNGCRALVRLGFGRAHKSYSTQYRSIQEAVAGQLPKGAAERAEAHLLLREHGKTLCKEKSPMCGECPLKDVCRCSS